jgi:signal transduction histidine kinase
MPALRVQDISSIQTSKSSGMGLSISRSIIQAPGGELWVDNDYPDGALLGFSLPVSE